VIDEDRYVHFDPATQMWRLGCAGSGDHIDLQLDPADGWFHSCHPSVG
jgi:hypothetical protein